jgi:hypothetical protein
MPRPRQPSPATQQLVRELALRDISVTCRAVEGWAARGLAPAPVRRSLGRGTGTVSEYPAGAAEQYAAVASVMRRGRPWQISVLKLLARGFLPADQALALRAFQDLLTPPKLGPGQDALDYAEQMAAYAARAPFGRACLRAFERNLRCSAQILEPGTQLSQVALGVVATLALVGAGEPAWSQEALIEMIAAYGIPVGGLSDGDRAGLARFAEAFFTLVTACGRLADTATESSLQRVLAAVPQARVTVAEALAALNGGNPQLDEEVVEVLVALAALMFVRIEDLGGDEAIAELARHALGQDHVAA